MSVFSVESWALERQPLWDILHFHTIWLSVTTKLLLQRAVKTEVTGCHVKVLLSSDTLLLKQLQKGCCLLRCVGVVAPSDFHLYSHMEEHLGCDRRSNGVEVQDDVPWWFCSQSPEFYTKDRHSPITCWHMSEPWRWLCGKTGHYSVFLWEMLLCITSCWINWCLLRILILWLTLIYYQHD